jgi:transposase
MAALRSYLRQRQRLLDYAAAHIQHMQKALMQMNLQLHHVVSDITGVPGMSIIRAIVAGERDPSVLASYLIGGATRPSRRCARRSAATTARSTPSP